MSLYETRALLETPYGGDAVLRDVIRLGGLIGAPNPLPNVKDVCVTSDGEMGLIEVVVTVAAETKHDAAKIIQDAVRGLPEYRQPEVTCQLIEPPDGRR